MARLLGSGGEFQEGIIAATRAIETLEATESNDFNDLLETAYSARAVMNDAAGKHKAAVADWDAILALSQQPHYALRRGVSLARMGDYEGAMATLEGVLTLHEEAPDPMLLFNAACVISRAIEAVEDVHDLTDEQRKSFVDAAEERGATIIERLLSQTDGERELWLQQTLQDPDIHRLSKSKRVKALIGPTAPPDPEAE